MVEWGARFLLLAADEAKPQPEGNLFLTIAPMAAVGVLFYFMLIRPQQRDRNKQDQLLKGLKKNDRVVTIGGVVGTIVNIEPDSKLVTLRVDDNTRMVFLRSAIQQLYTDAKEQPAVKETSS